MPPAGDAQSLNHWTTGEVPCSPFPSPSLPIFYSDDLLKLIQL